MQCSLGSVEEMAAVLEGSTWSTDFRQLDKGSGLINLSAVSTGTSHLMKTELGNKTHQLGAPAKGVVAFGLPTRDQATIRFGHQATTSDILTVFSTRSEFEALTEPGFSAYTAAFNSDNLEQLASTMGYDFELFITAAGNLHRRIPTSMVSRLRRSFEALLTEAPSIRGEAIIPVIEDELATEILGAFFKGITLPDPSTNSRNRVLRRALGYIEAHPQEVISVAELCIECACSISTLERAFREQIGVLPKQYLLAQRLSGVRKTIINTGQERGVGDIAANWGFWHLSKFSADYKRMFGELPSATTRANAA